MSRPPKRRFVKHRPKSMIFGPLRGNCDSGKVQITIDQLEALRLADLEGFSQEQAAEVMQISRQTFGRIIEQARKVVAGALINDKILEYEMDGSVEFIPREVKCISCGHEWQIDDGGVIEDSDIECPECHSREIIKQRRCGDNCECPLRLEAEGHTADRRTG